MSETGPASEEAASGATATGVEQHDTYFELARLKHAEARLARTGEVYHLSTGDPRDEFTNAHADFVPEGGHRSPGTLRSWFRRCSERASPLGQLPGAGKHSWGNLYDIGATEQRAEHGIIGEPGFGTDQGRAANGPQRLQFSADVTDRHGEPGENQAGEETSKEPCRGVQVPQAQARADFQARGQG